MILLLGANSSDNTLAIRSFRKKLGNNGLPVIDGLKVSVDHRRERLTQPAAGGGADFFKRRTSPEALL